MATVPITTMSPVSKDIDPATIYRLYHDEGMTIKAIAKLCGICQATVSRYLGPVKKGPRPKREAVSRAAVAEVVAEAEPRPKRLRQSKLELKGDSAVFEIDHESGTLYVRGPSFELLMTREEVEVFIWDLVEAYESIPRPKGGSGGDIQKGKTQEGVNANGGNLEVLSPGRG